MHSTNRATRGSQKPVPPLLVVALFAAVCFFFSSRRRHTRSLCDWSSDVCSSDLRQTLLQLGLSGAATWADARLDAAGAQATPHVESHTSQSCARVHAPDCALCHFLSAPAVTALAAELRLNVSAARPFHGAGPVVHPRPL